MKFLCFLGGSAPTPRIGVLADSLVVDLTDLLARRRPDDAGIDQAADMIAVLNADSDFRGDIAAHVEDTLTKGGGVAEDEVRYLPPLTPGKFLCVGKNNQRHLVELQERKLLTEIPREPTGFIKLGEVLSGHRASVTRPAGITTLDYEPELAFVISRRAHGIAAADAMAHVGAVTLLNDMTAREIQQREVAAGTRFWTAKNMPGFGPLGPVLVPLDDISDPHDLTIVCRVNGEERLRFQPHEQIYGIPAVLEHFSRYVPFEPGDVMSLGAPAGTAIGQDNPDAFFLVPGDVVEIHCDEIGTLATHIVDAD